MITVTVTGETGDELRRQLDSLLLLGALSVDGVTPLKKQGRAKAEPALVVTEEQAKVIAEVAAKVATVQAEPVVTTGLARTAEVTPTTAAVTTVAVTDAPKKHPGSVAIAKLYAAKGKDAAVALLTKYGVKKGQEVSDAKIQEFVAEADTLISVK